MEPKYWLWLAIFFAIGTVLRIVSLLFASIQFGDIFNILLGAGLSYLTYMQYKKAL